MCTALEEQVRGYTKTTNPNYSERLQELCRNGKFLKHVLSRFTEIIKTNIDIYLLFIYYLLFINYLFVKPICDLTRKRKSIYLGKGATGFF